MPTAPPLRASILSFAGLVAHGFVAPALAGDSVPGISSVFGDARLELRLTGFSNGIDAEDFAEAQVEVNSEAKNLAAGMFWSDLSEVGIDLGPTAGMISSDAAFQASNQMFSYRQQFSASGSYASDDQLQGDYFGSANFFVGFDTPTLVDIVIRLEVTEPLVGDGVNASVSVSGIPGQRPVELEYQDGDPASAQEYTIRTTIDSPRAVIFDFNSNLSLNPDEGFPANFGSIMVFGSVNVVPAPASLALLGLGLMARRRR